MQMQPAMKLYQLEKSECREQADLDVSLTLCSNIFPCALL